MEAVPIQNESVKLGLVGAGKMAKSIARGVVQSGVLPTQRISTAIYSNPNRGVAFQSLGVSLLPYNSDLSLPPSRDVITFSVKPQLKNVVLQLRPFLSKNKLLVSIAAGVKLKDRRVCDFEVFAFVQKPKRHGAIMSLGGAATEEDGELVAKLFGSVGKIWRAGEKLFGAITGLRAIEALADGGVAAGLPQELALGLASQTVLGAASVAIKSGKHAGQLKDDVTSPGGTSIAGIHELEKSGFRGGVDEYCCGCC
ncbi:pyrroline-5-carboxylate reductase-like [Durio zibethinus]|uniref:Pyrroline-5-carboxylate reductase-like n=1 Tax=Durio zibethinus TaxID=66656 RepID=A0A6P6AH27_DURZI|nr:pyrroline-5-carboxylate reductase-like [Durio zibethinus]